MAKLFGGWCLECSSTEKYGNCYSCLAFQAATLKAAVLGGAASVNEPTPPFTYHVFVSGSDKSLSHRETVDVSDDGELVCLKCRLSNCEHIRAVLELNLDVNIFYLDTVTVPIDLKHNVFVKFSLQGPPIAGSKIIRLHPDEGKPAERINNLGLLSNGDTRKVLRSILLDWLKFFLATNHLVTICPAKTHGYHEQNTLEKNLKARGIMPYLETWSAMRNNACLSCMEFANTDDDDLVPLPPKGRPLPPRTARRPPRTPPF